MAVLDKNTLTVAAPSKQPGDFIAGFSNDSFDKDVRTLIGAYGTHYVDPETAGLKIDPSVVENVEVTEHDSGDKTYTYTIKKD